MLPEQMTTGCSRIAAVLVGADLLKEAHAVAAHESQRLAQLASDPSRTDHIGEKIADLKD
jgi:hypothetical protein